MTASWGLTGPQFLAVYFVTYVLALALMYVVRAMVTRAETDAADERPLLDPYETAYLAGGPGRTVSAAIANLALRDQLLVSRGGTLTVAAGAEPLDEVDAAVAHGLSVTRRRKAAVKQLCKHPRIVAIGDQLRGRGLLVDGPRTTVMRACALLPCAVWIVGLIRLGHGIEHHHKVVLLGVLLVATGLSTLVLVRSFLADAAHRPSVEGQVALQGMRNRYESGSLVESTKNSGRTDAARQAQVVGVALLGFAALTDDDLRTSLTGDFGGADGGGCGSGGSCGGGGCGGGGCGGCGGCGG
ncbi:TIGR04222 domain-containing membrane protein [Mycolicibacterium sp. CBMA 226]|uniref:TIGR04222 domain-containing membrane protein n=1 Tax=Mycolicibacterium sp. CBMA 226 TaxID=2606611 RepID=UPI001AA11503|nr:TIGR04222 domain-containing membrane protein [Mycolicibacterium sp. CBMA 226]